MVEIDLRAATSRALYKHGIDVLRSPRRFLGKLSDDGQLESPVLEVLYRQCDEQWLGIFYAGARRGTVESLDNAARRAGSLLVMDRAIIPAVAERICSDIAMGIGDVLGLEVSVGAGYLDGLARDGLIRQRFGVAKDSVKPVVVGERSAGADVRPHDLIKRWRTASLLGRALAVVGCLACAVCVLAVAHATLSLSSCVAVVASDNEYHALHGSDASLLAGAANQDFADEESSKPRVMAVAAGGEGTVGLLSDGTLVATGETEFETQRHVNDISEWKNMRAVSRGETFILGLRANGGVSSKGSNEAGQCNVGTWEDVACIAAGCEHTIAARTDGTVLATGDNSMLQCDVSTWKDVESVAAGESHSLGLRSDGTVLAVGCDEHGECKVSKWEDVAQIAAGGHHSVARGTDGKVQATGNNEHGQCDVDTWSNISAIAAGKNHTVGLHEDGTVVATGDNTYGQCDVDAWQNVIGIAAGNRHTVGLCADGTILTAGSNKHGQLNVEGWPH